MIKSLFPIFLLAACIVSCHEKVEKEETFEVKSAIVGEWKLIYELNKSYVFARALPLESIQIDEMKIDSTSILFDNGIYIDGINEYNGRNSRVFHGNRVQYKLFNDSIMVMDPRIDQWTYLFKFLKQKNDTLHLLMKDSSIAMYKKMKYSLDTLPIFDQIIYSSTGCFGSCPIIDVSLNKYGEVIFNGEAFVQPKGLLKGKMDNAMQKWIFNKFRMTQPLQYNEELYVPHTDGQMYSASFIQNGKIVKTVEIYEISRPVDLPFFKAFQYMLNIHTEIALDSLKPPLKYCPKLGSMSYMKNDKILPMIKSESFFLLTELYKAKPSTQKFVPKYKLHYVHDWGYVGAYRDSVWQMKTDIKRIETDGQFYRFVYKNSPSVTLDLGYNFIDRNLNPSKFRKIEDIDIY